MERVRELFAIALQPVHLRRTALVALVVGTWLTAFNHGDELLAGGLDVRLAAKIALDYLTPFVVSNVGLLARQPH
ncbi:MAG TPA: nitrate/nitrite transporter NrtS [Rhodanobacteraceae bacterium]|nr:nitrate/nitrite transporter NrtS [Rhodanobacteraceae bacterium]